MNHRIALPLLALTLLAGCETLPEGIQAARIAMLNDIKSEPRGDYFIGRRYYKQDYKLWGYVRKPGESFSRSSLPPLLSQLPEHSGKWKDSDAASLPSRAARPRSMLAGDCSATTPTILLSTFTVRLMEAPRLR